jgi:hypothetical protein
MLSNLNKLIQFAEAAVPISELHLDNIKDVANILNKVKEARTLVIKLKSLCEPLRTIPLVSQLPLVREVLKTLDSLDKILKSINL